MGAIAGGVVSGCWGGMKDHVTWGCLFLRTTLLCGVEGQKENRSHFVGVP